MPDSDGRLVAYQAKCAAFLSWSQPFIYRLLKSLEPHIGQVVLTQRIENADLFPMPVIERLNTKTLLSPYQAHRAACRLQRKYAGDLLHAHHGPSAVKMLLLKHMLRLPMVATFGGVDLAVQADRPRMRAVYHVLFETCERFVAVSDDLRNKAIGLGCPPEKITTIYRGVDLDGFSYVDRSGRDTSRIELLMVSRLVPKKGHADALAALALLPPGVAPHWRLTILGEGPEENDLRRRASQLGLVGRVRFLGAVPTERVREEMARADILLHPSATGPDGDKEGVPNALIEAQATGLPVVATTHGGIPEAIRHGQTGLLVPERDPAALAAALAQMMASRDLRLRLGKAGRNRVESCFSLEAQARGYLELYSQLVRQYPRGSRALAAVRTDAPLPTLLREARLEACSEGELSISELFEAHFIEADGDSARAEPWWYSAFWRLKRHVPRKMKFAIKAALFRTFKGALDLGAASAYEQDDLVWRALRERGIPDPLEGPRDLRDLIGAQGGGSASGDSA